MYKEKLSELYEKYENMEQNINVTLSIKRGSYNKCKWLTTIFELSYEVNPDTLMTWKCKTVKDLFNNQEYRPIIIRANTDMYELHSRNVKNLDNIEEMVLDIDKCIGDNE